MYTAKWKVQSKSDTRVMCIAYLQRIYIRAKNPASCFLQNIVVGEQ
jgi:hypothetical protein